MARRSSPALAAFPPWFKYIAAILLSAVLLLSSQLLMLGTSCQVERERAEKAERSEVQARELLLAGRGNEENLKSHVAELVRSSTELQRLLDQERRKSQAFAGHSRPELSRITVPAMATATAGGEGFQGALVRSLQAEVASLKSQLGQQGQQGLSSGAAPMMPPVAAAAPQTQPSGAAAGAAVAQGQEASEGKDGVEGPITRAWLSDVAKQGAIAVVIISCKRPQYLTKTMTALLKAQRNPDQFPFVISQDDFDPIMAKMITDSYVKPGVAFHIHHRHDPKAPEVAKKFGQAKVALGYVRIAQHYGFALKTVFDVLGFEQLIFVEEDMEVAPDFFSYFAAMLPMLKRDPSLYCVSAWNDNGDANLVVDEKAAFRTEFFPGLGWMLTRQFWGEVRDRWAVSYWDEFMRRPDVRRDRHCIRPEVSRTYTFGEKGTSSGQFFKAHLSKIRINDVPVPWDTMNLDFLGSVATFDEWLEARLRESVRVQLATVDDSTRHGNQVRIQYDDSEYKKVVAKKFGLMDDEKEGIRRMSYRGVIIFAWKRRRVFLYTKKWPANLD